MRDSHWQTCPNLRVSSEWPLWWSCLLLCLEDSMLRDKPFHPLENWRVSWACSQSSCDLKARTSANRNLNPASMVTSWKPCGWRHRTDNHTASCLASKVFRWGQGQRQRSRDPICWRRLSANSSKPRCVLRPKNSFPTNERGTQLSQSQIERTRKIWLDLIGWSCFTVVKATMFAAIWWWAFWHQVAVPYPGRMSRAVSPVLLIFQAVGKAIFTNIPSQSLIKVLRAKCLEKELDFTTPHPSW